MKTNWKSNKKEIVELIKVFNCDTILLAKTVKITYLLLL